MVHIEGEDKGKIILYALSTCVWCKKTKKLLTELGVDFHYVYADLLKEDEIGQAPINNLPECRLDGDIPLWQISRSFNSLFADFHCLFCQFH
ncbi:MAG: hypothetical protein C4B59_16340, partial [Candidatus Methanogaster sp.]